MELRVLEYFLTVAREQSISRAAERLHLTQPTLSRQLRELEEEFGKTLFIRGKRRVTLTEEGMFFRKRAQEIVSLARRTEAQMKSPGDVVAGDIYIGAGETDAMRHIMRVFAALRAEYPDLRLHTVSGDTADLTERLDKGLFDFCLLLGEVDRSRYQCLELPFRDRWGVLLRRDDPLAAQPAAAPQDLWNKPLILSRQMESGAGAEQWFGCPLEQLNVVATYNLVTNAALMAAEGMGYVVLLDRLVRADADLVFLPLAPALTSGMTLVWKKYQTPSAAAQRFLSALQEYVRSRR